MSRAILLSGGIDSIALTYWKKPEFAITINYGQAPAETELRVSRTICELLNIKHIAINIDCSALGSGDLLKSTSLTIAPSTEWWPYRNQLLVTLASMKAISYGIKEVMLGSVLSDGFHKDGTEGFYSILNSLMNYQEGSINISAPAISLTSTELVHVSKVTSDLLFYAHSCHKSNVPCGHCRGCYKYIEVIQNLRDANW
ncbi:MAG: 7-cyano-7-deazaguanine synthase [Chitinophagaceae bacterium]|nr:7-cyano-7-deazaguanine synthase [Chitinophagaceae bacterium]